VRGLILSGAFDDPGPGATPPVIFVTSRVHTHFDFGKRVKYHGSGVEAGGNRLPRSRTPNEDVPFDAALG
jgi:hypothetical protein